MSSSGGGGFESRELLLKQARAPRACQLNGRAEILPPYLLLTPEVCAVRKSGGGGNRTHVRGRTGKSVYKLVLRFGFARRPVRRRPTAGLALLWSPASGEWLSLRG